MCFNDENTNKNYNPLIGEVNPDFDGNKEEEDVSEKAWYVINTFKNRERQVADDIIKRAKSMNIEDKIFRVVCAEHEEQAVDKDGKPKVKKDKLTGKTVPVMKIHNYYPGYVFVEMIMTDATWFVVRNTPNVSGITGSSGRGAKPIPIPREEIEPVLKRMNIEDPDMYSDYKVGDVVKIIIGTFAETQAVITNVDAENSEVSLQFMVFGRPQEYTCKFSEIEKVEDNASNF